MARTAARKAKSHAPQNKRPPVRTLAPSRVAGAVEAMGGPSGAARMNAAKAVCVTAERDPARVYPHFDAVAALLQASDSKIIRWNAMSILAALAPVDQAHKLDGVMGAFLQLMRGCNLVSAANAMGAVVKFVQHRPELLERVLPELLLIERAVYETPECTNVAIGQALDALQALWPQVRGRPEVVAFVRRQQTNPRAAVARRAARMVANLSG